VPYTYGFYTNEIADEAQSVVNANYQGNFERLLKVKDEYDPTNLFRLNANIRRTA
jgi:FAD/FMN-containing dehydrogenase